MPPPPRPSFRGIGSVSGFAAACVAALVAAACAAAPYASGLAQPGAGEPQSPPTGAAATAELPAAVGFARFVRSIERDDGKIIQLQVSSRTFTPQKPNQPIVHLVGVVHIGDQSYYSELQPFLDAQDLVLFEGVKPAGAVANLATADDAAKIKVTQARQRTLAILAERHKSKHGGYPASSAALSEGLGGTTARVAAASMVDGWGKPMELSLIEAAKGPAVELVSLGADGVAGGEQAAADLRFSNQKPLSKKEKSSSGEGIQTQLAEALGLAFQLTSMDYNKTNWRNSDLTIDQVQEKLAASGASADALFSLLDGGSFLGRLAGFMLGVVKASPALAMTVKITLVETLVSADAIASRGGGPMGDAASTAKLMKVIIDDRNTQVLDDLRGVIDAEPGVRSVAVFYGAGHLPDLETRLLSEFGYTFTSDRWFTAITLDLSTQPGAMQQAKQVRQMLKDMAARAKTQ